MRRALPLLAGLLLAAASDAHEGEVHRDTQAPLPAAALSVRPHRLDDGALFLPKVAQRLLGIRTQTWPGTGDAATLSLLAEAQAQPGAAVVVAAPEPGRIEPAAAWPLPGQSVRAGELLAWLQPQLSQRDAARRRAQLADLDQKLVIAHLNVERLGLQSAVNPDNQAASGNIYYEQAAAERDALEHQRALLADSLRDLVPLRAPRSGRIESAPARAGDVVAAGQTLFQLGDPSRLRLAVLGYEPGLGERLREVRAASADGDIALVYRGEEPLPDGPGWRLLFEPAAGQGMPAWSPGQPVELRAQLQGGASAPSCTVAAEGGAQLWLHRAPERFEPLRRASCAEALAALTPGERLVTQGAALLSQYH